MYTSNILTPIILTVSCCSLLTTVFIPESDERIPMLQHHTTTDHVTYDNRKRMSLSVTDIVGHEIV